MSNSQGGKGARGWEAFDKLPPTARAALTEAHFDWAPTSIYRAWLNGAKGFKTGQQIARAIAGWDADAHARDVKKGMVAP